MGETFYSVLGVSSDADTATIKEAYREKVKTHHPDVSDENDAAEQFQRITEAKDVLVDDGDRKRYDRLGHEAYVRRHLDSTAWSVPSPEGSRRGGGTDSASGRGGRSSDRDGDTGSRRSRRDRGSRDGRNRSRANRSGRTQERTNQSGGRATSESSTGTTDSTRTDRTAWMGEDGWSTSGSGSGSTASDGRQARSRDWRKQHAASNVYSPSGHDGTVGRGGASSRFATLARGVGPWIVFHFVFLVSAFVTMYLLLSWSPTVPTMFGSLLLLGSAIFFSILHMVSRIYS